MPNVDLLPIPIGQNGISSSWMPLWLAPARLPPPLERDGA
jgi:hypothetical protein